MYQDRYHRPVPAERITPSKARTDREKKQRPVMVMCCATCKNARTTLYVAGDGLRYCREHLPQKRQEPAAPAEGGGNNEISQKE